ncbi:hypothetical protein [Roseibium suaedae]|uniref:Uncharacterized protein n=1 Tax=Roseibium suaedae TaxID=735517 RepID=A0A1M7H750_9HYPH|nr:hypothetical protein [Roseibium suaedae]SHM24441.1 hypothetical protein SAMN05444272_2131 [Roseibium suaedae]
MSTIIWGVVKADGTILSGSTGNGTGYNFNVVNQSAGTYQIQFNDDFEGMPAITGSQVLWGNLNQSPLDNVVFPYLNQNGATAIVGGAGGDHTNRSFAFIAIGPDGR